MTLSPEFSELPGVVLLMLLEYVTVIVLFRFSAAYCCKKNNRSNQSTIDADTTTGGTGGTGDTIGGRGGGANMRSLGDIGHKSATIPDRNEHNESSDSTALCVKNIPDNSSSSRNISNNRANDSSISSSNSSDKRSNSSSSSSDNSCSNSSNKCCGTSNGDNEGKCSENSSSNSSGNRKKSSGAPDHESIDVEAEIIDDENNDGNDENDDDSEKFLRTYENTYESHSQFFQYILFLTRVLSLGYVLGISVIANDILMKDNRSWFYFTNWNTKFIALYFFVAVISSISGVLEPHVHNQNQYGQNNPNNNNNNNNSNRGIYQENKFDQIFSNLTDLPIIKNKKKILAKMIPIFFEVAGGSSILVTVIAFGILDPTFEFWNVSTHLVTVMTMIV